MALSKMDSMEDVRRRVHRFAQQNRHNTDLVAEYTDRKVQDIETGENQLIQHIRTAGLPKQKENSLVEEVMQLRKMRRQLVVHFKRQQSEAAAQVLGQHFAMRRCIIYLQKMYCTCTYATVSSFVLYLPSSLQIRSRML